jgi:hypothetical protein
VAAGRFENIGSVRNRGIELLVIGNIVRSDFVDWELTINASFTDNELLELGEGIEPIIFRFQRHVEGLPLGGYWDFPIESFSDANGDGLIGPDEVVIGGSEEFLGTPFPDQQLSIQSRLSLGNRIRVNGLLSYSGGHELLNFSEAFRVNPLDNSREINDLTVSLERQARAVAFKFFGTSAGYIEDASFWRLRELSVTYLAPDSWAQSFGGGTVSLTLSGRNLAQWTDYSGLDPEVNETGGANFTTRDFYTQPPVRYFTARINVAF